MTVEKLCQLLQWPEQALPGAEIDQRLGPVVQQPLRQARKHGEGQGAGRVRRSDQAGSLIHHVFKTEQPGMLDLPGACRLAVEQQHGERRIGLAFVQGSRQHPRPRELTTAHDRACIHARHSMDAPHGAGMLDEQHRPALGKRMLGCRS